MSNMSSIPTSTYPSEEIDENILGFCQLASFKAFIPYLVLLVVQCSLLHPTFAQSKLARLTRIGLTPVNFSWWFTLPFRYCVTPSEATGKSRLAMASVAIYMAIKSLEWGFANASYYRRPLKEIDGVKRWEKVKNDDHSYKKIQEEEPCDAFKLITWTFLQMSSMRGLQFTWGPAAIANSQSITDLLRKLMLLNSVVNFSITILVLFRDSPLGTPASGLASLGIPTFPGLTILAESIYTAAFGLWLGAVMDARLTLITIVTTLIHKLATRFHLPDSILDICDPINFPPIFKSPYSAQSLKQFWGDAWHTLFQRIFLIGGGKPMVWLMKKIGASSQTQRLAGLLGTFAVSAFLHEYIIFAIAQPSYRRKLFNSFPGSLVYFMLQPFGMLIEPYVIPLIPKRLGGGQLWVWTFSIISGYSYRVQFLNETRLHLDFPAFSKWSWMYILSPLKE
ncbi:hypothetical protein CROQUDRAFT_66999 [Cronartium quercuum f. sp. fusiforme G11]|uniref:Wax synthase domain-containing protein n=1 Tax=Cronartium quercuum f. sp. fusiforme G11 TaxID=708437 RepID=A0A9P6N9T7_9BASI|nr:hypothetical protein CROQUDRAFT_66999 [Cronartium quercuum f. sp. fusiforme G11]